MDAAAATAARPASSKQQRSLENSFAVQSRESFDEKTAACFYANELSFATRRDGARRRAGARVLAVVGQWWAHTPTPTRTRGGRCRLLGLGKHKIQSALGVSKTRKKRPRLHCPA